MSKALHELLAEPMEAAKEREAITFEKVVAGRPLVLFGAGRLGRRTLKGARAAGLEPLAFCDNNADLWGREIEGLPVLSLAQAVAKFGNRAAFVITIWGGNPTDRMVERERLLRAAGCRTVLHFGLLYWRYPTLFPHYAANSAHLVLQQTEQVRACAELCAGSDTSACLTAPQVAAVGKIWGGLKAADGRQIWPGLMPGGAAGPGGWADLFS